MLPENSVIPQPEKQVKTPNLAAYEVAFDEVVLVLYKEYRKKKKAEQFKTVTE